MRATSAAAMVLAALALVPAAPGRAQEPPVVSPVRDLDFDAPESWAMKYFTAVSLATGLGPPREGEAGSVELGLELGWIPHLDSEERRVGFTGTKPEDLNKLPAYARPRVTVGLPAGLAVTLAWTPPVEVGDVRANLLSVALAKPVYGSRRWGAGLRLHGQVGDLEGSFTCPEEVLAFEPGEEGNLFGCRAESDDRFNQRAAGLELAGSRRFGAGGRGPSVHFSAAASYLDLEFQVDALTFDFKDRTLLRTDGWIYSVAGGVTWPVARATELGVELFYTPLDVRRLPASGFGPLREQSDDLVNARVLLAYRLR